MKSWIFLIFLVHINQAGASITTPPSQTVRLSNNTFGTVEVYYDGEWGTVCDFSTWDYLDAQVVCRQLGYSGGIPFENAYFGQGSGPIWLHFVACMGTESSLSACENGGWGPKNCDHAEDVGVKCLASGTTQPSTSVRLSNDSFGTVEVYYSGEWGTICDMGWNDRNAEVVCRQLGYSGGIPFNDAYFGQGSGLNFLNYVGYRGSESSLSSCEFTGWGNYDCGHNNDAGVKCQDNDITPPINTVRLSNGTFGTVEIYYSGEWGTICDSNWDDMDAQVVCRQLGYSGGNAYMDAHFGQGSGLILLKHVSCAGTESSLSSCIHGSYGNYNCGHENDSGVQCLVE